MTMFSILLGVAWFPALVLYWRARRSPLDIAVCALIASMAYSSFVRGWVAADGVKNVAGVILVVNLMNAAVCATFYAAMWHGRRARANRLELPGKK